MQGSSTYMYLCLKYTPWSIYRSQNLDIYSESSLLHNVLNNLIRRESSTHPSKNVILWSNNDSLAVGLTMCCPCITFGANAELMGEDWMLYCLFCILPGPMCYFGPYIRHKIRKTFEIEVRWYVTPIPPRATFGFSDTFWWRFSCGKLYKLVIKINSI